MSYARAKQISAGEIPVIDVAALATHDPAAILAVGRRMREASETVGFFYVKNHGVPQDKIDRAFTTSKAFFQAPFDKKNEVKVNEIHRGFIGIGGAKMVGEKKPDLKESFVWGLELSPNDPDVLSGKSLMGPNQWPSFLPELRARSLRLFSGGAHLRSASDEGPCSQPRSAVRFLRECLCQTVGARWHDLLSPPASGHGR